MDRLVSGGADREADDAWCVAEFPDDVETSARCIERQVEQPLEPLVFGQNAFDEPAIVCAADRHLNVILRMHAEQQHRRRKDHLIVEAHRIHSATCQFGEMVTLGSVHGLSQSDLMRDAAIDVLIQCARLGIEQRRRSARP